LSIRLPLSFLQAAADVARRVTGAAVDAAAIASLAGAAEAAAEAVLQPLKQVT
jgi:hypothetical protein